MIGGFVILANLSGFSVQAKPPKVVVTKGKHFTYRDESYGQKT